CKRSRLQLRTPLRIGGKEALISALLGLMYLASTAMPAVAAGDSARGERVFQRCFACHSVDPNETAKLQGPSLYRIMGRPAAAILSFEYSDAMRARGAAGLVWGATTLEDYIADPESVVAGRGEGRQRPAGGQAKARTPPRSS